MAGGGGGDRTNTQRTELDPRMNNMLYGTEINGSRAAASSQLRAGRMGQPGQRYGGSWDPRAFGQSDQPLILTTTSRATPGLVDYFQQQFQAGQNGANYAGMTDMQRNALNAQADYRTARLAGLQRAQNAGRQLPGQRPGRQRQ